MIFPVDMHVKLLLRGGPHLPKINYKYLLSWQEESDRKIVKSWKEESDRKRIKYHILLPYKAGRRTCALKQSDQVGV
jgi:hypothetical protein